MEKIQNGGLKSRLKSHLGIGSIARIAAFTASASVFVSMFRYFQSFTSSDRVSQYTVAVRFIQFGTSHMGFGATQSSVRSHSAGVTWLAMAGARRSALRKWPALSSPKCSVSATTWYSIISQVRVSSLKTGTRHTWSVWSMHSLL